MPKSLSLKKATACSSKNQKPITQFFKTSSTLTTQAIVDVNGDSQVKTYIKRKATSPVENVVASKQWSVSPEKCSLSPTKTSTFTPKKIKIQYEADKNPSSFTKKISPHKENSLKIFVSPCKSRLNFDKREQEDLNRAPLSQLLENHVNNICDQNDMTNGHGNLNGINGTNNWQLSNEHIKEKHSSKKSPNNKGKLKLSTKMKTPDKKSKDKVHFDEASPSKSGATVKLLDSVEHKKNHTKLLFQLDDDNVSKSNGEAIKNHILNKNIITLDVKQSQNDVLKLLNDTHTELDDPLESNGEILSSYKSGAVRHSFQSIMGLESSKSEVEDEFGDDWVIEDEDHIENLDLSIIQRCEVISVTSHAHRKEIRLKNNSGEMGTCFIEGIWLDTPLSPGEIVSVLAANDSNNQFLVSNMSGFIVLRPDHMLSSTGVVAGVFCRRKAVIQERWKGIDSANTAMTIGILVHELVQKALTERISSLNGLNKELNSIVRESIQMLYDAGLSEEEAKSNMQAYVAPLAEFMTAYFSKLQIKDSQKNKWKGHIDEVLDIEENVCCPQLGLKGKIDATLQVTIHDRKGPQSAIVPLELKSGKASASAEHRGQLVLYGMMLSVLKNGQIDQSQRGLLLYLRDKVDLLEVSGGHNERRDLIMLRNQLVQYLSDPPDQLNTEQITDIEEACSVLQQKLPEPIHHSTACGNCSYLTICSTYLWHTDGAKVSENHPLSQLKLHALGHLTQAHIKYFLHWTTLVKLEEKGQMTASPLHSLWNDSVEKRVKRGTCAPNLTLISVEESGDRFIHVFLRQLETDTAENKRIYGGPQEGDYSIVSVTGRPWIAAGVVLNTSDSDITVLLERNLQRRQSKSTLYHIDTYESYSTSVQNLTNLGVLLEDSDRALRLRRLIIDKENPEFEHKQHRSVGRLGAKLMKALNIQQQRAVLRAIAAKDYALLRGLPGTGKTQTISVLIQMLVAMGKRVLVTAHTHSAVDTVLKRLPQSLKVMRLGSSSRVSPDLSSRCEQQLTGCCETPEQLAELYDSMEVVGVTCLGAAHAMLTRTTFDVCIVDEATQVLQCTVLRPLFAAIKFVLVGDPDQLPPVVRSRAARRLGMEESLFHRLMSEDSTSTLQLQYRMNQALVEVANKIAYSGRLKCADEKVANATASIDLEKLTNYTSQQWILQASAPGLIHAAMYIDTSIQSGRDNGCVNRDEACIVLAVIDALKQSGVKATDIGVIAPYREQVSLLRSTLQQAEKNKLADAGKRSNVEVSTVDQFQGRDKSVVIYSCTRSDCREEVKEGEVLNDQRRLAVSVTRAKHKLIVIGHGKALDRYVPLKNLIQACSTVSLDSSGWQWALDKYKHVII